jgi:hypothetical protein
MWGVTIGVPAIFFALAFLNGPTGCNPVARNCGVLGLDSDLVLGLLHWAPSILILPAIVQIILDNIYRKKNLTARDKEGL